MPISITIGSSPKRQTALGLRESTYLIELAAAIAQHHPSSTIIAQYGPLPADVMVIRQVEHGGELF